MMLTQYQRFVRKSKPRIYQGTSLDHIVSCTNAACWCKRTTVSKTIQQQQAPKPILEGTPTLEVIGSYLTYTPSTRLTHSHSCRYCNTVWQCKIEGYCEYEQAPSKRWSKVNNNWSSDAGEWPKHDCWSRLVAVARFIRMQDMASELDNNPYTSKVTNQPANQNRTVMECIMVASERTGHDGKPIVKCVIPEHTLWIKCIRDTGEEVTRSIHAELSRKW